VDAPPLLEINNLSKVFTTGRGIVSRGEIRAVDNVSLTFPGDKPTLLTMVGESGSGKTTIARMVLGLTEPTSGEVRYRGRNIYEMSREEWAEYRKQVQVVFQDPYGTYNPFYKIDRVLKLPIKKFGLVSSIEQERELIEQALRAVELRPNDILGRYPHQLSGGERQRIMLARLYLVRPQLIIADEPVSMIDVSLRASFLNILLDFEQEYGMSCIFITHNLATGYYLGGEIVILCQGRIVEMGDMDSVVSQPRHPYSQLLIASVPSPDPQERWTDTLDMGVSDIRRSDDLTKGCIYRDRCPHAFELCRQSPPPMVSVGENHQVACYLYK
jgi:oligopeptide/dipeptide ABC transporter ATP-binding protein